MKTAGVSASIATAKNKLVRGGNIYSLALNEKETEKLLRKLRLYDREHKENVVFHINPEVVKMPCCKKAFVRGAFLGGASVVNPEKGYHLEFVTNRYNLSQDFCNLLLEFGLRPKSIKRKSSYIVYFKNSDEISDILSIIGAHNMFMEFLNVKILKETRNNINRKVNCENANIDKTISAAFLQIKAINRLKETGVFDSMPEHLKALAELRLKNKGETLQELGEMMEPKISKSAVNHRFRKIIELYEKLEDKDV